MKVENLRDFILYQSENTNKSIEVLYDNEDFWLTQKTMAELFNVKVNTINYHLKEVFSNNELNENSVIRKIRITATDGKDYNTNFYSLDAIIAVGYRVNSKEATNFRIWATNTLKEYIKKGFVLNTELLNNETIAEIANNHNVSSAQVILRWNLQKGVVVIPGSSNPNHIKENTDIYNFQLTEDEMKEINDLDRNEKHDWY